MIAFVKRTLKLERVPPIFFPFIIPFVIAYFFYKVIRYTLLWVFGFWACCLCKRIYWAKEEKNYYEFNEYGPDHYTCGSCKVMKVLTESE